MWPPPNNRASLLAAIALALLSGACQAPWSIPEATTSASAATPPAVEKTPPAATDADLAGVIDKLEQVGELDPAAQQKLMQKLRNTEPRFWPATAEQFRASLAYHQELVAHKDLARRDGDAPPEQFVAPNRTAAATRPMPAPPFTVPMPPSSPVGALADPRRAGADGVWSEALARSPFTQKPPFDVLANVPDEPNPPAEIQLASAAVPVSAERLPPASESAPPPAAVVPGSFQAEGPSTPLKLEKVDDDDWQQLVTRAADDLSGRVAKSPATTAEIHQHVSLRILRLLAGQTEAAMEPIPHIAPAEQDYWSRQIFALATYLDHHSQPDEKRRAAAGVTHLDEAVANLRELGALNLRNFAFCRNIYGYGAIEPYTEDKFSPGQQVTLYVEVENYHSRSSDKGFITSLGSTYEILDEKRERVDGGQFPTVDDCCRSRRRDFHIQFGLKLPDKIAPGRYQLELVVRDRQSDKIAHATASFEIRGNTLSSPPPNNNQ